MKVTLRIRPAIQYSWENFTNFVHDKIQSIRDEATFKIVVTSVRAERVKKRDREREREMVTKRQKDLQTERETEDGKTDRKRDRQK